MSILKKRVNILEKQIEFFSREYNNILRLPFDWSSRMGWFSFEGSRGKLFVFKWFRETGVLTLRECVRFEQVTRMISLHSSGKKTMRTQPEPVYEYYKAKTGAISLFEKKAEAIWRNHQADATRICIHEVPHCVLEMIDRLK